MRRTRENEVAVVDENAVAVLAELAEVEVGDGRPELGKADELGAVESNRVVDRSRTVDDPAQGELGQSRTLDSFDTTYVMVLSLLRRISSARSASVELRQEEGGTRTGSEISVRATSLDLGHLLLVEAELAVDSSGVGANRQRGHSEAAGEASAKRNSEGREEDVRIVRNTTVSRGRLARRERLPPGSTAAASVG